MEYAIHTFRAGAIRSKSETKTIAETISKTNHYLKCFLNVVVIFNNNYDKYYMYFKDNRNQVYESNIYTSHDNVSALLLVIFTRENNTTLKNIEYTLPKFINSPKVQSLQDKLTATVALILSMLKLNVVVNVV